MGDLRHTCAQEGGWRGRDFGKICRGNDKNGIRSQKKNDSSPKFPATPSPSLTISDLEHVCFSAFLSRILVVCYITQRL